jgi:hypothetical protein
MTSAAKLRAKAARRRARGDRRSETVAIEPGRDLGRMLAHPLGRLFNAGSISLEELQAGAEILFAMELAALGTVPCAVVDPSRIVVDGGGMSLGHEPRTPKLAVLADLSSWMGALPSDLIGERSVAGSSGSVVRADTRWLMVRFLVAGEGPRELEKRIGVRNGALTGRISNALQLWIRKPWQPARRQRA